MARPPARPAKVRPPPKAPTAASLHEAALAHLARYAATETGVVRVLDKRIARWSRAAAEEAGAADTVREAEAGLREAARQVARRLVEAGAIDDAGFARARTRSLSAAGKSRRAIGAHLAARGVEQETAGAANLADGDRELGAALITARKRRLGAFRTKAEDAQTRRRELGSMARAGFSQAVSVRALGMEREEAEAAIKALRDG